MATEDVLARVLDEIEQLKARIDDLEAQVGETDTVDLVTEFPNDPYPGQLIVRVDEGNSGGLTYRYDGTQQTWIELG